MTVTVDFKNVDPPTEWDKRVSTGDGKKVPEPVENPEELPPKQ